MRSPDTATRVAFARWRDADPSHARAYDRVGGAYARVRAIAGDPALMTMRHEAVARATLGRPRRRLQPRTVAAAVLLLATAPLAALGIRHLATTPTVAAPVIERFATAIGERRQIALPDGSVVTLDTASRIEIAFGADERRVAIDGQGWFRVRPSALPFVIVAGSRTFTATGGAFDVRTDPGWVRAFAQDGTIAMAAGPSAVTLDTGHLLKAHADEVMLSRPADPATITGWRDGLLRFDDVPLAEAANELNRYRTRPLRIADAGAAGLRVSGVFRTTEGPAFVDALTTGFPIRVQRADKAGIVLASR